MNEAGEVAKTAVPSRTSTTATAVATAPAAQVETVGQKVGRYRWVICALLFFATTVNYVDRQVLGILAKDLKIEIGWSEIDYGNIVAAFNAAYAFGLLLAGRLMDRIGTRAGYAIAIVWWSIAAMAHALARTPFGFGVARAALGIGEAGNFPAAIKTVAEWFPKKERAFATGIFNAGSNVGAIVAPLTVPLIASHPSLGWRWAFILTGAIGFVWLLFWLPLYRHPEKHARVSPAELAHIQSDPPDPPATKIPWVRLIPHRQTSAFAIGKYLTDPIWWFYLYWIPNFFRDHYNFDLLSVGPPLIVIYLIADVGSIGGGWLSSTFIKRGWTINRARKTAMLICALAVTPIVFASNVKNPWVTVALIGIAAAAHQGWSCNLFTMTSDMFPRRAVGSVVGIGGMAGALGGATMAVAIGYILESTGQNYSIAFMIAGLAYLLALTIIHLLVPQLDPVADVERAAGGRFSLGTFIGFGFVGLVFGSFVGWCVGLLSRVQGPTLFKYMMIAGAIGIGMGMIGGLLLNRKEAQEAY